MRMVGRLEKHLKRLVIRAALLFAIPICVVRLISYIKGREFSLILTHSWGGGSESFLRNEILAVENDVLLVRGGGLMVEIEAFRQGKLLWQIRVLSLSPFLVLMFAMVSMGAVRQVLINHLVEYKRLGLVMKCIRQIGRRSDGCQIVYLMHDHYSLCPSMFLLNADSKYCGIPNNELCEACAYTQGLRFRVGSNMLQWRQAWEQFLSACDKIVCFSNASKAIVLKAYGVVVEAKIEVVPHKIDVALTKPLSISRSEGRVRIGILGNLSRHKGLGFVAALAQCAQEKGRGVDFVVIGSILEEFAHSLVKVHGKYNIDQLPLLARLLGVDFFLIPSIVPETFSYAAAEVMALSYPLVVLNLGAPGERVKTYRYGKVLDYALVDDAEEALKEMLAWYCGDISAQARRLNAELSSCDLRDVADKYFKF